MLKVVIDTSIFVAAYLSKEQTSYSAQMLSAWRASKYQLVMTPQILEEVVAKLIEKGVTKHTIVEFTQMVGELALQLPGAYVVHRLDKVDPGDNKFLAAAAEADADYLVSLDAKHILPLKYHVRTQIVSPALFMRAL